MQQNKSIVIFSIVILNIYLLLAVLYSSTDGMVPPHNGDLALFCVRMILFTSVTALGTYFITCKIDDQDVIITREFVRWGLPILGLVVLGILLSSQLENPLYFMSCCGEGGVRQWGYPFAYLKGVIYHGGRSIEEINWISLIANINFGLNTSITIVEIGKSVRTRNARAISPQRI